MPAPMLRVALLSASLVTPAARLMAQEPSPAQESVRAAPGRWLVGASIGVPGHDGESFPAMFTVGAHWTQLDAGRVGADFSVGTVPWVVRKGIVAVGARGGVALPVALSPRVTLLPSGGVSVVGAVGSGGGDGTAGFNAGIAAVLLPADGVGVRTGVTWHRFGDARATLWLWELGVVRNPRRR